MRHGKDCPEYFYNMVQFIDPEIASVKQRDLYIEGVFATR